MLFNSLLFDVVFYLFISDFITLTSKDDMLVKMLEIKDFYVSARCSNTIVSTWDELIELMYLRFLVKRSYAEHIDNFVRSWEHVDMNKISKSIFHMYQSSFQHAHLDLNNLYELLLCPSCILILLETRLDA